MVEPIRPYYIPPEPEEIEEVPEPRAKRGDEFPEARLSAEDEEELLSVSKEDITGLPEGEEEFPELEFTEDDSEELFGTGEPKPKYRARLLRRPAIRRYPLPPSLGGMNV